MSAEKPMVYINNLTPEWLIDGLRRAASGEPVDEWKKGVTALIQEKTKGAENVKKSLRYLRHIYIEPTAYTELREEAFKLYRRSSEAHRDKILTWGLATLTYPFLNEVTTILARLLRVQQDVKMEQFVRRLSETFGEKETVIRSGTRCLKLIVDYGFLNRSSLGNYTLPRTLRVDDPDLVGWLLKIWFVLNAGSSPVDRTALCNHPALLFFDAAALLGSGLNSGILTIDRMSMSQETVSIRTQP
jgi:hypothetical protein